MLWMGRSEKGWTQQPSKRYCVEATLGLFRALQQGPSQPAGHGSIRLKAPKTPPPMPRGVESPLDVAARLHSLHTPLLCSPSDAAAVCKKMPQARSPLAPAMLPLDVLSPEWSFPSV